MKKDNSTIKKSKKKHVAVATTAVLLSVGVAAASSAAVGFNYNHDNNVKKVHPDINAVSLSKNNYDFNYYIDLSKNIPTLKAYFTTSNLDLKNLKYQWYKTNSNQENAVAISGATSNTFTPNVKTNLTGVYYFYCVASYGNVSATSSLFTLNVLNVPKITLTIPKTISATQNETVFQTINASVNNSDYTLTYTWYTTNPYYKNNSSIVWNKVTYYAITNSNSLNYTLTSNDVSAISNYSYLLSATVNLDGNSQTYYSNATTVNVTSVPTPSINIGNSSYTIVQNQTTNLPTFSPTVSGGNSLSYQWYSSNSVFKNNSSINIDNVIYYKIPNADNLTYQFLANEDTTIGSYKYILGVTNSVNGVSNTTYSNTYTVTVNSISQITIHTINNATAYVNQTNNVTFSANITIPSIYNDVNYNWYEIVNNKDVLVASGSNVLTITSFKDAGVFSYYLQITATSNGVNTTVKSNTFTLTINNVTNNVTFSGNNTLTIYSGQSDLPQLAYNIDGLSSNSINTYQWYTTNHYYDKNTSVVFNGVTYYEVSNATNSTLTLNSSALNTVGSYDYILVVTSDFSGNIQTYNASSTPFVINVKTLTSNSIVFANTNYNLNVTLNNLTSNDVLNVYATVNNSSSNLTYQWYNATTNTILTNETSSSLTITNALLKAFNNQSFSVYCVVSYSNNGLNFSANSSSYNVIVSTIPTVTFANNTQTINAIVNETVFQTIYANASSSNSDLTVYYEWYNANSQFKINGTSFSNSSSFTLTKNEVQTANTIYYVVKAYVILNGVKYYTNNNLEITVHVKNASDSNIDITNPTNTVFNTYVSSSNDVNLSINVTANNVNDLTMQWYSNNDNNTTSGVVINDANSSLYQFNAANLTSSQVIYYYCIVSGNINGVSISKTSAIFTIYVNAKPTLTFNSDLTYSKIAVINQTPLTLYTGATIAGFKNLNEANDLSNVVIAYTWYSNHTIVGNGVSYTLSNSEMSNAKTLTFYVVASATIDGVTISATSQNYTVTLNNLPTLNTPTIYSNYYNVFTSQKNAIDLTSNFTTLNNPNVIYSYQWYSSNSNTTPTLNTLSNYTKITNATTNSYSFSNLTTTNSYFLVISATLNGAVLTPVISNVITINVLTTPTITFNNNIDYDIATTKNATDLPILTTGASLSDFTNHSIVYSWYGSTTNNNTNGVALNANGVMLNLTSAWLSKYTYFYVVATSEINGNIISATSKVYTITINNQASITFSNNINYNATGYVNQTNSIILQTSATSSNNAAISYTWYDAINNQEVSNTSSLTFTDFSSANTFSYYVIASIVENGSTISKKSGIYTITINATPTLTLSSNYTNNVINATLNETNYQTLVVNATINANFNLTYSWANDDPNTSNTYTLNADDVNAIGNKTITCTVSANINGYSLTKTITFTIQVSNNASVVWKTLTNYNYTTITNATTPINLSVSANSSINDYAISYSWYSSNNADADLKDLNSLTSLNNNTANYSFSASKIDKPSVIYLYVLASFVENGVTIQSLSTPFIINIVSAPSIIWNNNTYSAYNDQTNDLTISAVANLSDGFTNSITYTWPNGSVNSTYTVDASSFNTSKSSISIPVIATSIIDGYKITSTSNIIINLTALPTLTLSSNSGLTINATQNETVFQTIYSSASFNIANNYGINYAWFNSLDDVKNLSKSVNNTSSFTLNSDYVKTINTIYEVAYSVINGKTIYSNVLTYTIQVSTLPTITFNNTTTNYNLIQGQTTIPTLNASATANNEDVNYAWFASSNNTIPSNLQSYLTTHTSLSASNNYTPSFTATNDVYYLCIAYVVNNGVYTTNALVFTYHVINNITISQTNEHFNYDTTIQATNPLVLNATFSINNLPSDLTNWNIGAITYQWYSSDSKNTSGVAINNQTNASYSFSAANITSATTKYVYVIASVVINGVTISSNVITTYNINVMNAPTINWTSGLTLSYNVLSGTNLTLNASAVASDSSYTIYYLWNDTNDSVSSSITLKDLTKSQTISVNAWIVVNGTKYSTLKPLTYTINVLNKPDAYFTYNTTSQTKTVYNNETGNTIFSAPTINVVSNSNNYDVTNADLYYAWYNSNNPNTIINNSASLTIANNSISSSQTYYVVAYYLIDGIKCYVTQSNNSSSLQSTNYTINYSTLSQIAFDNSTSYTWYKNNTLPNVSVNVINNTNNLSIDYVWSYNDNNLANNSATLSSSNLDTILNNTTGIYKVNVTANLMLNNTIVQTITQTITLNYLANPTLSFNDSSLNNALTLKNTINSKNPIILNGSVNVSGDSSAIVSLTYSWYNSSNDLISNDSSYSFSANSSVGNNTYILKVTATYHGNVVATITSGIITIQTIANPTITLTTTNNTTINYLNGYKISQILSVNSTLSGVNYVWTWNSNIIANNVASLDLNTLSDFKNTNTLSVYATSLVNGNTITSDTITFIINTISINTNDFTFNNINNNITYTNILPTLINSATFTQNEISSYTNISYSWYSNSSLTTSLNNDTNSYTLTSNLNYGDMSSYYLVATLSINGINIKSITQTFNVSRLVLPTITISSLSSNESIYANSKQSATLNVNATLNNALNWNNVSLTYTWYNVSNNEEVGSGASLNVTPTTTSSYYVVISGTADGNSLASVKSNEITITVLATPTLSLSTSNNTTINYYQNQTTPITLNTSLSSNSPFSITYVWALNGVSLKNDNSSYTISNFSNSSYTYSVYAEITNSIFNSVIKSNVITFTLTAQTLPTNSVVANQSVYTVYNDQSTSYNPTLSVSLANNTTGNVAYNWYVSDTIPTNLKNGSNSIGNNITYTNSSKYTQTLYYYAIATVDYSGVKINYYMTNYITVNAVTPTLTINTLNSTYDLISGISNVPTLSVNLTNPQNISDITYVWNTNNTTINNDTSSYTLNSIPSNNTTYTVYATSVINDVVVKSNVITFTINVSAPNISNTNFKITLTGTSAFSASSSHNENMTLDVSATSNITNANYNYTWYENGVAIANSNTSSLPFSVYGKYLIANVATSFSVVVTLTIGNTTLTLNSLKNSNSFSEYNVYLYQNATISGNYHSTLPTTSTDLTLYQNEPYILSPNISVISNGNLYSYQWVITNLSNNTVTNEPINYTYNPINTSETVITSNTGNYEYYLKITLNGVTYYSDVYKITINANTYNSTISYNGTNLVTDVHLASGMSGKFNLASILNNNNVNATYNVVFGILHDSSTNKTISVNSDGILDLGTLSSGSYNLSITSTYTSYQTFSTTYAIQIYVSSIQTLANDFGWHISVSQSQTANYIYANQTANLPTFSVSSSAGNSGVAFSYEWLQDNIAVSTSSSFHLLNTSGVTSNTTWTCNVYVIYMGAACLWTTKIFNLTVYDTSDITLSSNTFDYTTMVGQNITLNQTALLGSNNDDFTYDWNNSVSTITSNNGSSYTFNATTAGSYSIVLLITLGNLTKTVVYTITVLPTPTITYTQTNSVIYIIKNQASNTLAFSVNYNFNNSSSYYTNNLSVSYIWKNSSGINVSDEATYTPDTVASSYTLTITFSLNGVTIVSKTLNYSVVIYSLNSVVNSGQTTYNLTTGQSVSLTPSVNILDLPSDITSSIAYSWALNGNILANTNSYTFNSSTTGQYTYYFAYVITLNGVKFSGNVKYIFNVTSDVSSNYTLNLSNLNNGTLTTLQYGASNTIATASVSAISGSTNIVAYNYSWTINGINNNQAIFTDNSVNSSWTNSDINNKNFYSYFTANKDYAGSVVATLTLSNGNKITLTTTFIFKVTPFTITINANGNTTINVYNNQSVPISLDPIVTTNNSLIDLSYSWNGNNSNSSSYTISDVSNKTTTYTLVVTGSINGVVVNSASITYTLNFLTLPTITITNNTNQIYYINKNTSSFPTLTPNITMTGELSGATIDYAWTYNTVDSVSNWTVISNADDASLNLNELSNLKVGTYYCWLSMIVRFTNYGIGDTYIQTVPYEVVVSSNLTITSEPTTNTTNHTTTFSVGQNYTISASAEFSSSNGQSISYYWEELDVNPNANLTNNSQSDYNVWTPIVGQTGSATNSVTATLSLGSDISSTPTQEFRCVFYQTNDPSNSVTSSTITITTTYTSNTQAEQNLDALLANPYWDMGLLYAYGGTNLLNLLYSQNSNYSNWIIFGLQITNSSAGVIQTNGWTGDITSIRYVPSGSYQFSSLFGNSYAIPWNSFLVSIETTSNVYIMSYTNSWNYNHLTEIPSGTTIEMYLPFYFFGSISYTNPNSGNTLTSTRSVSVNSNSSSVTFSGNSTVSREDWSLFKLMFNNPNNSLDVYGHSGGTLNNSVLEWQLPSGFNAGTLSFTTANTNGYMPDYNSYIS